MSKPQTKKTAKLILLSGMLCLAVALFAINLDNRRYKREVETYRIPDVTLINHNRRTVRFTDILRTDKPLILQFIYTGCTTVCPVMMVKFSNLQRRLEPDTEQLQMVSISIDPEHDTPNVLDTYRRQYRAQPGWVFLTGPIEEIRKIMSAFKTDPADMATLDSPILLRAPGSDRWIRLTGKIDSQSLWNEYLLIPQLEQR